MAYVASLCSLIQKDEQQIQTCNPKTITGKEDQKNRNKETQVETQEEQNNRKRATQNTHTIKPIVL